MKDSIKLSLSAIFLFALIVFAFQKNLLKADLNPLEMNFQTQSGMKNLKAFKGKIILMYFGFLTCPEACPTTMNNVTKAFKQLSKDELDKITFIFVDLDPKRDTVKDLTDYLNYFHSQFVFFSAKEETTRPFARFFGVNYREVPLKSKMDYTIDHSTDMIVLDPNLNMLENIHHGTDGNLMATTIKKILKENFTKENK